jgi:hypothetical protein
MVIAKVYHDKNPTFMDSDLFFLDGDNQLPDKYELVAEVTIEAREKLLTNERVLSIVYEGTHARPGSIPVAFHHLDGAFCETFSPCWNQK